MATWDEVRELANKLKETQNQPNICKLSDRTWVDIIQHLMSVNRLKLVFSTDGRSYLTRNELDKEIRDEVEAHSGRITLTELASNLDVDFDIIESRVTELITLDAQNKSPCRLISIPSEVVNSSYVRRVAHEILDRLEEHGQTSIGELTVIFNLPTTFLSSIMQEYQSTLFHVHKYGEKYFTDTFLNATKAKIRGYFTGVIRPVTLSSVASKLQIPENLINSIVSSLISTGRLYGNLIAGRSGFVPKCYTYAEDKYINSFYSQNGYIEWNYLKRLNIPDPGSYLKTKLPNAMHLPGLTVNTLIVDQLKSLISGVIRDVSWIDLSHYIPNGLDSNERSALVNPLLKDAPVKLLDTYLIADKFIESCEVFLDTYLTKKAQTAFHHEHHAILSSPTQQQSVEVNTPKQVVTSPKGGFGFGAREIKTKNVKKKYNPSKQNNFPSGIGDSQSLTKDLFARYVLMDDVRSILSSQLPNDVPSEMIDQVADMLEPILQQSFIKHIGSLISPSAGANFDREKKLQTQEVVNSMVLSLQLLERGISSINRDILRNQLLVHLLKNYGMPILRQLCDYISYEFGIPWPESTTSKNDLSKTNSSDSTQNNNVKSNITESLSSESYHRLLELLKHTSLPDAVSISSAIQQVLDSFKVGQNNLTSLDTFYTSIKNLSVDVLGLTISVFHSSNSHNNKRERDERLKANELAIQVEMQLKESVCDAKINNDLLKVATTATLAATCLFAQIINGWPVTAPGKCVPELIDWFFEALKFKTELESNSNEKSNSHITALKTLQASNVLDDLSKLANYISEKVRSGNVFEESDIQAHLKHILDVGIQCRRQLYA
ncbi:unnamed protein product [Schistosoma margrebowiei]|uniref:E3 UFM1-protein ligase 1 homolog n=1 Tax=Schistosoma margrebowiei TaxID=48269 RepID=A0AA84Z731_9TREM|nr:unnamed protein product [Schistosoma margrebowiei]